MPWGGDGVCREAPRAEGRVGLEGGPRHPALATAGPQRARGGGPTVFLVVIYAGSAVGTSKEHPVNQTRKDVLNGWKEIAGYLGRDPRTVERWEKTRSLPVRRLPGSGRATVYALVSELDQWLASPALPEAATAAVVPGTAGPFADAGDEETSRADPASGEDATEQVAPAPGTSAFPGERRRWPWLRATTSLTLLLLVCWAGITAAGWKYRKATPLVAVPPSPHGRRLVPSSPVLGVEELYLRGCYQAELRTPETLRRAQEAYSAAVAKDPRYAPAYAGLANTYLLAREYSMVPDAEAYTQATAFAQKALSLDPDLPQAHAALGFVEFFWRWDGDSAEKQFRRALEVDPDLALAHHWYGSVLTHEGKFREGAAELTVAQQLDPTSSAILTTRALAMALSGRRAEATEMLEDAVTSNKAEGYRNPATMHHVLGVLSLIPPRDLPRYLAETTLAAELRQDMQTASVMQRAEAIYRQQGENAMWRALLLEEQKRQPGGKATYAKARYEAELGANTQALDDLAELFSRHDPSLIGISIDQSFVKLRREPRFVQLRAEMGLPGVDED